MKAKRDLDGEVGKEQDRDLRANGRSGNVVDPWPWYDDEARRNAISLPFHAQETDPA